MRKSTTAVTTVLALVVACSLAQALEITSRQTGPDQYQFLLRNDTPVSIADARVLFAVIASPMCQGKIPSMGSFNVMSQIPTNETATSTPAGFQITQEVACTDVSQIVPGAQLAAKLTAEQKLALEREVRIVTERHFRLVDTGMLDTAIQDLSPDWDRDSWRFERQAMRSLAGKVEKVNLVRVTALENPPGAPQPGIYISVDFRNSYQNVAIECGNFMWMQIAEGEFRIARAGHRYVTKEHLASLPATQIPAVEHILGCRAN